MSKRRTWDLRESASAEIAKVTAEEEVNETEALHRLVKWGAYLRNAAKEPGTRILIERDDVQTEVVFL